MNRRLTNGVRLDMTGEEFKRLIEQQDANGEVDTLRETFRAMEGIGDNERIVDYVQREVEAKAITEDKVEQAVTDVMAARCATNADIYALFGLEPPENEQD